MEPSYYSSSLRRKGNIFRRKHWEAWLWHGMVWNGMQHCANRLRMDSSFSPFLSSGCTSTAPKWKQKQEALSPRFTVKVSACNGMAGVVRKITQSHSIPPCSILCHVPVIRLVSCLKTVVQHSSSMEILQRKNQLFSLSLFLSFFMLSRISLHIRVECGMQAAAAASAFTPAYVEDPASPWNWNWTYVSTYLSLRAASLAWPGLTYVYN